MTHGARERGTGMEEHAGRVAAELHDGAMQEITLARLQLDLLAAGAEPALRAQLVEVAEALDHVSARLRAVMRSLHQDAGGTRLVQTSS